MSFIKYKRVKVTMTIIFITFYLYYLLRSLLNEANSMK